ncbi:fibronectin type III domain-containing protein 11-like [Anguilla anguilla]|uniref:fibronectin type III domain-containing protein 11-like n=1 Tax=Anguilla anguilla TaxID=7936 RepID=UPI0015AFFC89|nr:fibronectin type III domain-containing protein 11-like [Anguilla anguilla]
MNELNSAGLDSGVKGQQHEEKCDGLRSSFQKLVSSKLSDEALSGYRRKLETLKKCSFYVKITCKDPPQSDQGSTFSVQNLIDRGKFQQLKKFGNGQAKIQLCLLEELLEQVSREKDEVVAIIDTYDEAAFTREHDTVQKKLAQVNAALLDFNSALDPGPLHFKHRLIMEPASTLALQIQLDLVTRMPVFFDRSTSVALTKTVRLYWHVAGPERCEVGVKYEVHYKLCPDEAADTPACEDEHQPDEEPGMSPGEVSGGPIISEEARQLVIITCSNSVKINGLLPDRSYEFTVKRADSFCWVYGSWRDTIVLKTLPRPAGSTNHKKKRCRFQSTLM